MLDFIRKYRYHLSVGLLVIIYTVGIVLICSSKGDKSIIDLTPYTLLLTSALLFLNHNSWNKRIVIALVSIFLLGLAIEIIGVNTGIPFGEYSYSDILGIQVAGTPYMIGVNWLMLVYAGVFTIHRFISKIWLKAVVSGIVLVVLDVFIEPVAINWNMWTWKTSDVPIQNYITWGLTAIVFSLILSKQINATNSNKMAPVVLILQFVFFLILGLCG